MYDVVIIGSGINGSLLAYYLSQYQLKAAVIEKENDVANGTTMANSAIVHEGYDPEDGTRKSEFNVKGARMYQDLCAQLGCLYKKVGAYIVANNQEEEDTLDVLADRAKRRGVKHAFLSGEEARIQEPYLADSITKVLSIPDTAIIYPWEVAIAAMEVAITNGVELYLNHECTGITKEESGFTVEAGGKTFLTKVVINAAGYNTDQIDHMVSDQVNYEEKPKRGEYFVLDSNVSFVNHIIFPVPSSKGKGVLAVPTVYGNTLLGPTSDPLEERNVDTTRSGLQYIRTELQKTMKDIPMGNVIRTFAGLRASTTSKDFIIEELEGVEGFIHIASVESPGLASAPAIATYVMEELVQKHIPLNLKEGVSLKRNRPVVMNECTPEQRDAYIKANPKYATIICRCEQISEQEIVDCIHRPCGATTIKGVKKRVRPGMGKCQGGFCEPRVAAILARELNIPMTEVLLDGKDSKILEMENR